MMERFVQSKHTSQYPTLTTWMCQFNSDSIHLHSKSQSPKENWKYGFLWNILWPIKCKENPIAKGKTNKSVAWKNKGNNKRRYICWPGYTHKCNYAICAHHIISMALFQSIYYSNEYRKLCFNSIQFIQKCKIPMQRAAHFFSIVWKVAMVCRYHYWLWIIHN